MTACETCGAEIPPAKRTEVRINGDKAEIRQCEKCIAEAQRKLDEYPKE